MRTLAYQDLNTKPKPGHSPRSAGKASTDEVRMTGQEVKELRKKRGLTQQELADIIGVDRVTVARWEIGEKKPSNLAKRQLSRLAKKVNTKVPATAK